MVFRTTSLGWLFCALHPMFLFTQIVSVDLENFVVSLSRPPQLTLDILSFAKFNSHVPIFKFLLRDDAAEGWQCEREQSSVWVNGFAIKSS